MNFSTLRDVFIEEALRNLGHGAPYLQQRFHLPVATNEDVLHRLNTLEDLISRIKDLQHIQENFRAVDHVDRQLKVFCRSAGRRLVRACGMIEYLRCLLSSRSPGAAFLHHQSLVACLLQVKESLAFWEESIGAEEFYKRHARPREVRYQYLEHTLRLVFVIADLTFPEGLRAYIVELEDVLGRPHLRGQFQFDSPATYARTKGRARVGVTAPHDRCPKRFIPYGMKKLRPFWYRNPSLYGHLQVANEHCVRQLRGAFPRGWPRRPSPSRY